MAKLIGGPLHDKVIQIDSKRFLVPIHPNNCTPKQISRGFDTGVYERTNIQRDGEQIFRFVSGYYETERKLDG